MTRIRAFTLVAIVASLTVAVAAAAAVGPFRSPPAVTAPDFDRPDDGYRLDVFKKPARTFERRPSRALLRALPSEVRGRRDLDAIRRLGPPASAPVQVWAVILKRRFRERFCFAYIDGDKIPAVDCMRAQHINEFMGFATDTYLAGAAPNGARVAFVKFEDRETPVRGRVVRNGYVIPSTAFRDSGLQYVIFK